MVAAWPLALNSNLRQGKSEMKNGLIAVVLLSVLFCAQANRISDSQQRYIKKYEKQKTVPQPDAMLLNTDPEPALTDDFTPLFNGKDLNGWAPKGGKHTFEAVDGVIRGFIVEKDDPGFSAPEMHGKHSLKASVTSAK